MTDDAILRRTVRVGLPRGLHLRPLGILNQRANEFPCDIQIRHQTQSVNAKGSVLELMLLAVPEGTELELQATGPQAEAALSALAALFEENFGLSDDEFLDEAH